MKFLDFGASWGYSSCQLMKYGIDVQSYEISKPRADFDNRSIDQHVQTELHNLREKNNIFFSFHVIEHMPNPMILLNLAQAKTRSGGPVVTLCPNGRKSFRASTPCNLERYGARFILIFFRIDS